MKQPFAATVWREGKWYVSQCLEVDIASQGESEEKALANLKEALELHFEPPHSTRVPEVRKVEVGLHRPCPTRLQQVPARDLSAPYFTRYSGEPSRRYPRSNQSRLPFFTMGSSP